MVSKSCDVLKFEGYVEYNLEVKTVKAHNLVIETEMLHESFQGCIFFCLTPPPNNMLGKQLLKMGGGKCMFFPHLVKSMHIFPQLTQNILNCKKKG